MGAATCSSEVMRLFSSVNVRHFADRSVRAQIVEVHPILAFSARLQAHRPQWAGARGMPDSERLPADQR
ncbi:MAG: hypothetical protein JWM16_307 [Verrucomicrobiales bacterium]|nr:hypothetical protein [Verrucomicrobiales bacterium]